jgi:hypothetical protein
MVDQSPTPARTAVLDPAIDAAPASAAAALPEGLVHDLLADDGTLRLTAVHRCDARACGAQAYALALVVTDATAGSELLFCRHHAEENRAALAAAGLLLLTDYSRLGERLDVSA